MIQNNMSVRKNKRQARKYPSTDFLLLLCIMLFCRCSIHQSNERINLEGTWRFAIDRQEVGISEQWYLQKLPDYVQLPGSMLSNGKEMLSTWELLGQEACSTNPFLLKRSLIVIANRTTLRYLSGYSRKNIIRGWHGISVISTSLPGGKRKPFVCFSKGAIGKVVYG